MRYITSSFAGPLTSPLHRVGRLSFSEYADKVLAISPGNIIGYWPMWEPSGATAVDQSPEGNDGAYTGVTLGQAGIGDGRTCPFFDGTNDYNDVFSAGLGSDINKDELTIGLWGKINSAALWTDTVAKELFRLRFGASGGYLRAYKTGSGGNISVVRYEGSGGGGSQTITWGTGSPTGFFSMFVTQSIADDKLILYDDNGDQVGAAQTGLLTYEGTLDQAWIGSSSGAPGAPWHGWLAHVPLLTTPLAAAQIAKLVLV